MKLTIRAFAPALVAAGMFAAQTAAADTLNIKGYWSGSVGATITAPVSEGTSAGGFEVLDVTTSKTFQAWCVDIYHTLSFNTNYTLFSGPVLASGFFTAAKATDLARLATLHSSVVTGAKGSIAAADEAAFQLAAWEIVTETASTYDLTTGVFKTTSTANATANTWLSAVSGYSGALAYTAQIWVSGTPVGGRQQTQDLLVFAPVPEPETYAMMLAGLGLLGFVARRRKQKVA
jgi:hypothetical protein